MIKRLIFVITMSAALLTSISFGSAESIILKSGQRLEEKITEHTDAYIKVDIMGAPVTYFLDQIESIDGVRIGSSYDRKTYPPAIVEAYDGSRNMPTERKCFLWEVISPHNVVYLLGSIHVANKNLYPLDAKIEEVFNRSDILVVEADITQGGYETANSLMEKVLLPEGEELSYVLSEHVYNLVLEKFSQFAVPLFRIVKYKPWYLAVMLQQIEMQRLGFYSIYGIDYYFLEKAKNRKPIYELESIEYQIELFNSLSREEQELTLLYTIMSLDRLKSSINELLDAWRYGDVQKIEYLLIGNYLLGDPRLQPVFEKIFYQRNRNIVSKIEGYLHSSSTYFIVVGAGHLVGQEGIIELLKQKGYTIIQLNQISK